MPRVTGELPRPRGGIDSMERPKARVYASIGITMAPRTKAQQSQTAAARNALARIPLSGCWTANLSIMAGEARPSF